VALAPAPAPAAATPAAPSAAGSPEPAPATPAAATPAQATPQPPAPATAPAATTAATTAAPASGAFVAAAGAKHPASGTQLIQVAAVENIAKGRDLQRRLRAAGFDAYWESVRHPDRKGELIRVRVAVDRATQSVAGTLAELQKRGFEPVLVNP
jgi:cell division septation protein DedD